MTAVKYQDLVDLANNFLDELGVALRQFPGYPCQRRCAEALVALLMHVIEEKK